MHPEELSVPPNPFEQGRRFRAGADGHRRVMEQAAARMFEMAQRHSERLEEQRLRLAQRLRLRGGWIAPRPLNRRKPGREPDAGGVPAVPDRPKNLSGGAAAALEYEED
jgi:hypothetical protein